MSGGVLRVLRQERDWVSWQGTRALDTLAYSGKLPWSWARRRVTRFWDSQAGTVHERWGRGNWDFPVLSKIIQTHHVCSVLDIGCGSGRLFALYQQQGITRVLGIDISAEALRIARRDYPNVQTQQACIEDLDLQAKSFDLIISNRVLQHIHPAHIGKVTGCLCAAGRLIYINELSTSDGVPEEFFMFCHDYTHLFAVHEFILIEGGRLGKQTWQLWQYRGCA